MTRPCGICLNFVAELCEHGLCWSCVLGNHCCDVHRDMHPTKAGA